MKVLVFSTVFLVLGLTQIIEAQIIGDAERATIDHSAGARRFEEYYVSPNPLIGAEDVATSLVNPDLMNLRVNLLLIRKIIEANGPITAERIDRLIALDESFRQNIHDLKFGSNWITKWGTPLLWQKAFDKTAMTFVADPYKGQVPTEKALYFLLNTPFSSLVGVNRSVGSFTDTVGLPQGFRYDISSVQITK